LKILGLTTLETRSLRWDFLKTVYHNVFVHLSCISCMFIVCPSGFCKHLASLIFGIELLTNGTVFVCLCRGQMKGMHVWIVFRNCKLKDTDTRMSALWKSQLHHQSGPDCHVGVSFLENGIPKKLWYQCCHLISVKAITVECSSCFWPLAGAAARLAFRNVMGTVIAHAMWSYCRGNQQKFPTFNGSESVKSFTWNSMFTELRQTLPTLYAAVNSSMPNKLRKDKDELGYIL